MGSAGFGVLVLSWFLVLVCVWVNAERWFKNASSVPQQELLCDRNVHRDAWSEASDRDSEIHVRFFSIGMYLPA